jgi:hypothetical protein
MAQQTINVGTSPNDGTGTPLRTAFQYTNSNFSELYTAVGPSGNNIVVPGNATITGDLTVDTSTLKVDSVNNRVGVGTASPAVLLDCESASAVIRATSSTGTNTSFATFANTGGAVRVGAENSAGGGLFTGSSAYSAVLGTTGAYSAHIGTNGNVRYSIDSTGVSTWLVGGSTAMTLNSTGLGVGGSPTTRFEVFSGFIKNTATTGSAQIIAGNTGGVFTLAKDSSTGGNFTGTAYASVLYSDGAYPVCIFSNGSERMRIDSSGNVGVGVTPSAWATSYKAIELLGGNINTSATNVVRIYQNIAAITSGLVYKTGGLAATGYVQSSGSHFWQTAPVGANANDPLTLTTYMTLDASGRLLVGKTASNFATVGSEIKANGSFTSTQSDSTNVSTAWDTYSTGASAYRFYVGMAGTVFATNTTISAISDARFKENIQDLDVGLGAILALKPRKFDWKAGKGKDIKGDRGFIAQEFEQVFPQLVDEWRDNAPEGEAPYKSVRQDLIPVLVKAIQELTARVEALEA